MSINNVDSHLESVKARKEHAALQAELFTKKVIYLYEREFNTTIHEDSAILLGPIFNKETSRWLKIDELIDSFFLNKIRFLFPVEWNIKLKVKIGALYINDKIIWCEQVRIINLFYSARALVCLQEIDNMKLHLDIYKSNFFKPSLYITTTSPKIPPTIEEIKTLII